MYQNWVLVSVFHECFEETKNKKNKKLATKANITDFITKIFL